MLAFLPSASFRSVTDYLHLLSVTDYLIKVDMPIAKGMLKAMH